MKFCCWNVGKNVDALYGCVCVYIYIYICSDNEGREIYYVLMLVFEMSIVVDHNIFYVLGKNL